MTDERRDSFEKIVNAALQAFYDATLQAMRDAHEGPAISELQAIHDATLQAIDESREGPIVDFANVEKIINAAVQAIDDSIDRKRTVALRGIDLYVALMTIVAMAIEALNEIDAPEKAGNAAFAFGRGLANMIETSGRRADNPFREILATRPNTEGP